MAKARSDEVGKVIDDANQATALPQVVPAIEQFSGRAGSFE